MNTVSIEVSDLTAFTMDSTSGERNVSFVSITQRSPFANFQGRDTIGPLALIGHLTRRAINFPTWFA